MQQMLVRVDEEMLTKLKMYRVLLDDETKDFKCSELARDITDAVLDQIVEPGE